MLNHTAGTEAVLSACRTAGLHTVVTSRRFIELAKLDPLAEALGRIVEIVWLEIYALSSGSSINCTAYLRCASAPSGIDDLHCENRSSAILFTSGSEGAPKGVVLSHANLLANRRQLSARVDFSPADQLLNALPMFHSFGLTAGFLLPTLIRP